eukprot:CAMPEP_0179865582 /NCGR_PEP_ID=MMETSP0982-20121206/16924_1 /TAXON_ID=483367 /ORGANISM="non described non described, Strain CCMP 2436" /LENGTH=154 /DNA_ID=CAMNT_0021754305 /DNA_START=1061 /DNA_END=1522 /DNA_ORIENTATION=+
MEGTGVAHDLVAQGRVATTPAIDGLPEELRCLGIALRAAVASQIAWAAFECALTSPCAGGTAGAHLPNSVSLPLRQSPSNGLERAALGNASFIHMPVQTHRLCLVLRTARAMLDANRLCLVLRTALAMLDTDRVVEQRKPVSLTSCALEQPLPR